MNAGGNIILIGMPGAGKSTLGVVLAKILGKDFIDGDLLIQRAYGKTLHELIEEHGVEGFLDIEEKALSTIEAHNSVIATGGSAIYSLRAMKYLGQLGPIVYLSISYESLQMRLEDLHERGVVMKAGTSHNLQELYQERLPLYEHYATITVDVDDLTITQAARKVAAAVKEV